MDRDTKARMTRLEWLVGVYKSGLQISHNALEALERQRVSQRRKCPWCKRVTHTPNCGMKTALREGAGIELADPDV